MTPEEKERKSMEKNEIDPSKRMNPQITKRHIDSEEDQPFVVPPFAPPPPASLTYVWWSWHPLYPYWSKSCWAGATIKDAQEHLEKGRLKYYHNKLIQHDGMTLVEVQDEPCREIEVWRKIKLQMQDQTPDAKG